MGTMQALALGALLAGGGGKAGGGGGDDGGGGKGGKGTDFDIYVFLRVLSLFYLFLIENIKTNFAYA